MQCEANNNKSKTAVILMSKEEDLYQSFLTESSGSYKLGT